MKLKIFCKGKDIIHRTKQQPTDWEKIFTNSTFHRGLISQIYKELKMLDSKKPKEPNLKMSGKCSKSLFIRELKIKMSLRFYLTAIRMAKYNGKNKKLK
jgi:hypothetical protein